MSLQRRQVLALTGGVISGLAGCLLTDDTEPPDGPSEQSPGGAPPRNESDTGRHTTEGENSFDAPAIEWETHLGTIFTDFPFQKAETDDPLVRQVEMTDSNPLERCQMEETGIDVNCESDAASWVRFHEFEEGILVQLTVVTPHPAYDTLELGAITAPDANTLTLHPAFAPPEVEPDSLDPPTEGLPESTLLVYIEGEAIPEIEEVTVATDRLTDNTPEWFGGDSGTIDPDAFDGWVRADGEPPAVPEAGVCQSDGDHDTAEFTGKISYGQWPEETSDGGWMMRAIGPGELSDDSTVTHGQELPILLRNLTGSAEILGPPTNAIFEIKTTDGWEVIAGSCCFDGPAFSVPPGGGHTWNLTLTPAAIGDSFNLTNDGLACETLPVARYRFRYPMDDGFIAVTFDLEQPA